MFDNRRIERKLERIERKLDLIMRHLEIGNSAESEHVSMTRPFHAGTAEIDELLRQGKKIQAIKVYRELNPTASLKEAKDAVEARQSGRY